MIANQTDNHLFEYRVAAVIVDGERVLLQRGEQDQSWSLPGGQVKKSEASPDALLRVMCEVLDCQVEIIRLQWVVENFVQKGDIHCHEVVLYYMVQLPKNTRFFSGEETFPGVEGFSELDPSERSALGAKTIFQWFPRYQSVLEKINLLPAFLQNGLVELPEHTVHVVNKPNK